MDPILPWLRLHLTEGLGRKALFRLLDHFGSPVAALKAPAAAWKAISGLPKGLAERRPAADDPHLQQVHEWLITSGTWLVSFWDDGYPALLKTIVDPPALLYGRGRLPAETKLAIVGSRAPTTVGRQLTRTLAADLAARRITVVSGLARGIDADAHAGALAGGGQTIAVLGCGIDRIYPPEHRNLADEICQQGCLLSEYPPGTPPLPGHFPGRNRIISGLSEGTLVVEAARNSGSLITAEFALDQGREVFAVPGSVNQKTSEGTNQLIKEGAHPVTETLDLLCRLCPDNVLPPPAPVPEPRREDYSETAWAVLSRIDRTPLHIDEIAEKSGLTPMEVSVILLQLELNGDVEQQPGSRYLRGGARLSSATNAPETA